MNKLLKAIILAIVIAFFVVACLNLYDLFTAIIPSAALSTTISAGGVEISTDEKLSWALVGMIVTLFLGILGGTKLIFRLIDKWVK